MSKLQPKFQVSAVVPMLLLMLSFQQHNDGQTAGREREVVKSGSGDAMRLDLKLWDRGEV